MHAIEFESPGCRLLGKNENCSEAFHESTGGALAEARNELLQMRNLNELPRRNCLSQKELVNITTVQPERCDCIPPGLVIFHLHQSLLMF